MGIRAGRGFFVFFLGGSASSPIDPIASSLIEISSTPSNLSSSSASVKRPFSGSCPFSGCVCSWQTSWCRLRAWRDGRVILQDGQGCFDALGVVGAGVVGAGEDGVGSGVVLATI